MHAKSEEHTEHRRLKKKQTGPLSLFLVIVGIGAALVFFLQLQKKGASERESTLRPTKPLVQKEYITPPAGDRQPGITLESSAVDSTVDSASLPGLQEEGGTVAGEVPEPIAGQTMTSSDSVADDSYRHSLDAIASFYQHLDQETYLHEFQVGSPSRVYFSQLAQRMLDTPPLVSGETNDLFSILQNTAHFFRVVGRENILALKAIISHEKDRYEAILAEFYLLSHRPDYLESAFNINLKQDALYDYAGFFLTTMGGRLYLFRRDSALRMIVSYYSILIVEEANQQGRNRHGIDLRPAVDSLINELETGGDQLKLRDQYLDRLYSLKEKYL